LRARALTHAPRNDINIIMFALGRANRRAHDGAAAHACAACRQRRDRL